MKCVSSSSLRLLWLPLLLFLALGCTPGDPLERIRRDLEPYPQYSVILQDMRQEGNFSTDYYHQYKMVWAQKDPSTGDQSFGERISDWHNVSGDQFRRYEDFLGMTILSKGEDGQVTDVQYPAGYQYVGDSRYGQWRSDSSGNSFWEFYGKYALISHLFGSFRQPIYRNDWDSYRDTRRRGQPYYGPGGNTYGTRGSYTRKSNPTFFERQTARQTASRQKFSDKVRSRTGRSTMSGTRSRSSGRGGK